MSTRRIVLAAAVLAVAALGMSNGPAAAAGDAAKGEKLFQRCQSCHSLQAGQRKIGPSLAGVIGRKAGTAEGFKYSDAMASADLVWDDATLDAYLAAPKKIVPGNKMVFPGLPKEQDRADVIAYLHQAAAP